MLSPEALGSLITYSIDFIPTVFVQTAMDPISWSFRLGEAA